MAIHLKEVEPDLDPDYICTPTSDELPEMFEHWRHLGELLGKPILPVVHHLGLNGLIAAQGALPNWRQRWCTRILKIEPFARYLEAVAPATSYVGLRADEEDRPGGLYTDIPGVVMRFPLREWGWGIEDVYDYLDSRGVQVPDRTDCARCFFQRLPEWHALWRDHPAVYLDAERQEREIGHTFRSPGRDTWPAALADLRAEFERGRIPRARQRKDSLPLFQCRACTL